MTPLLQRAFDRASQLPSAAQDRLGAQMLSELEADAHWDELLADPKSEVPVHQLARTALQEYQHKVV